MEILIYGKIKWVKKSIEMKKRKKVYKLVIKVKNKKNIYVFNRWLNILNNWIKIFNNVKILINHLIVILRIHYNYQMN